MRSDNACSRASEANPVRSIAGIESTANFCRESDETDNLPVTESLWGCRASTIYFCTLVLTSCGTTGVEAFVAGAGRGALHPGYGTDFARICPGG